MNDTKVSRKTLLQIEKNTQLNWKYILLEIWFTELNPKGVSYDEFVKKMKLTD